MFDNAITDFSDFDVVMKMNLLQSAINLCAELYEDNALYEFDCGHAIDKLNMVINLLDEDMH